MTYVKSAVAACWLLTLASAANAQIVEPWVGRWSIDSAGCTRYGDTANTAPLVVTDKTVNWFLASCRIGKLYKTGQDAHIQAHCSNDGGVHDIPISLKPHGNRMKVIWNNAPVAEMQRCR
jgi:hypothetical protein